MLGALYLSAFAVAAAAAGQHDESALAAFEKTLTISLLNATMNDPAVVHELCEAGKFRPSSELPCKDCPIGYFQNLPGGGPEVEVNDLRSGCKICVHGFFQDEMGHQACKECPDGFASNGNVEADAWLDFGYEVQNNAVRDGNMANNTGDAVGDLITNVTLDECGQACNTDANCNNFAYSFFQRDCQKYTRCLTADEPPAPRIMTTLKGCTCKDSWTHKGKEYLGCAHVNEESGYRKMCYTVDNCNSTAFQNEDDHYFDYCPQDPVWITYHRSCIEGGVERCIKDCRGFSQTGECPDATNPTTLVMTPDWDTPDSTDTCKVTIDQNFKGNCECYPYDGAEAGTRDVGESDCELNQPFTTCDELCDLHYTAMWRATDECKADGERVRMYDQQGEEEIDRLKSGYCQCEKVLTGEKVKIMESTCDPKDKSYKTCKEACDDYWSNHYNGPNEAGP